LLTTGKGTQLTIEKGTHSQLGVNRVLLYVNEAPVDRARAPGRLRVACVDVRYVDGVIKSPSNGLVSFAETGNEIQFQPANQDSVRQRPDGSYEVVFNPATDCKDRTSELPPNQDAGSP
jgi:hypothetical protein